VMNRGGQRETGEPQIRPHNGPRILALVMEWIATTARSSETCSSPSPMPPPSPPPFAPWANSGSRADDHSHGHKDLVPRRDNVCASCKPW